MRVHFGYEYECNNRAAEHDERGPVHRDDSYKARLYVIETENNLASESDSRYRYGINNS